MWDRGVVGDRDRPSAVEHSDSMKKWMKNGYPWINHKGIGLRLLRNGSEFELQQHIPTVIAYIILFRLCRKTEDLHHPEVYENQSLDPWTVVRSPSMAVTWCHLHIHWSFLCGQPDANWVDESNFRGPPQVWWCINKPPLLPPEGLNPFFTPKWWAAKPKMG